MPTARNEAVVLGLMMYARSPEGGLSLGIASFFTVGQAKGIAHATAEITPEPMLKPCTAEALVILFPTNPPDMPAEASALSCSTLPFHTKVLV